MAKGASGGVEEEAEEAAEVAVKEDVEAEFEDDDEEALDGALAAEADAPPIYGVEASRMPAMQSEISV